MPFVRLYRREVVRELARLKRIKWSKLPYPNFVIQAESEINPDRTNDPDVNFSEAEAIGGFITPIPIRRRTINTDIRLFIDEFGRPDPYAIRFFKSIRSVWNDDPKNQTRHIYCLTYDARQLLPRNRARIVQHKYLQTLRGEDAVRQLDRHLVNGIDGLEETRLSIQPSANVDEVDRAIREVLEENERIQNGGD